MTRQRFIGMAVGLILAAAVVWLMLQPAVLPPADSKQDDMADLPAMGKKPAGEGREASRQGGGWLAGSSAGYRDHFAGTSPNHRCEIRASHASTPGEGHPDSRARRRG